MQRRPMGQVRRKQGAHGAAPLTARGSEPSGAER